MTITRNFSILAEGVNSSGVLGTANGGTGGSSYTASYLVVAGGGAGGYGNGSWGTGGGGAGGVVSGTTTLIKGVAYFVVVGAGGTGSPVTTGVNGTSGSNSSFGTLTASAGGGYDNSIVLNASGDYFDASASGLFIKPVRYTATQDATDDGLMFYNQTTGEVRYSYLLDGGAF